MSDDTTSQQTSMFSAADSPVRMSALPENARVWLENDPDSGSSFYASLRNLRRELSLLKTFPDFYPQMPVRTSQPSFKGWSNAGIASAGGCWTLSISESPSAAAVCSLSEVLEMDAAPKYFLSARACQGILNRASRRGNVSNRQRPK